MSYPHHHTVQGTRTKKTITHYNDEAEEDKKGLVARCDYNSDSDDDAEPSNNPPVIILSKVSSSPSESTKSHPSITITPPIKGNETLNDLDKTMHYHLDDKKLEDLTKRVTSKAENITSKWNTNTHPLSPQSPKKIWLMSTIQIIITSTDRAMSLHKYRFEKNRDVDKHNTKLIKKQRYDFVRALDKEYGTMLEPRSEFWLNLVLELL